MKHKRRGFTLIELLVVIAIIAILAAMLFPVFARARESARKIQCLANVKNIATAFQLYFSDYDRFPPAEHNPTAIQYFSDKGCTVTPGCCNYPTLANPYMRWPVILDEYTKNRDIWRCPSARNVATATWIVGPGNWLTALQNASCSCVCQEDWPNGWGGTVTDSFATGNTATLGSGAFEVDYTANQGADTEKKLSAVDDPAKHIVVAERGIKAQYWGIEQIAYPEICRVFWYSDLYRTSSCAPTCSNGSDSDCGPPDQNSTDMTKWINNFWGTSDLRKKYTRHMGGNNIGFADGHAAWMPADAMIAAANANPQQIEPIGSQALP